MSAMLDDQGSMTIGEVLSLLAPDFPDVSISKIRFLESEGLIAPQRAPSGYRRFTTEDVETLRLILTAQRDRYLPLRVIKEQLRTGTLREFVDPTATEPSPQVEAHEGLAVVPDQPAATLDEPPIDPRELFTRRELSSLSGVSAEDVEKLTSDGVITPDPAGRYVGADVLICQAFGALRAFGVEVRHLRMVKNAASRDSSLITNAVQHLADPDQADAIRRMLDALSQVHYWQVVAQLHRQPPGQGQRQRQRRPRDR